MSDQEQVELREYMESRCDERTRQHQASVERVERIIEERGRLYETKLKALETFFTAALLAMEKATASAFAAAEKAILKAEEAQREYNMRSNEFRASLDDANKHNMPRTEALGIFKAHEDRMANLSNEIATLKEFRSTLGGRDLVQREVKQDTQWNVGTMIAVCLGLLSLAMAFAALLVKVKNT